MKPALLLSVLLFANVSAASAAGLNLSWQACPGDGGVANRTFACDTNGGDHEFVASLTPHIDILNVSSDELVVDITTASLSLPDWWRFRTPGSCRLVALSIAYYDGTSCPDMFGGSGSMNIADYRVDLGLGPNRARILCLNAVTPAGAVYVDARQEYAIAKWRVSNIKTVGSGACIGCGTPATIEFRSANICAEGGLCYQHTLPAAALSNVITWQTPPTPTRSVTWGAVKSLYH